MKTVFLIRHAKSSWQEPGLTDFERPLNERGRRDAPAMAERLKRRGARIGHIVSSPAVRALRTAEAFADAFGIRRDDIERDRELYLASPERFPTVIAGLDDARDHVAIVGHNEGITDFANGLGVARIDDMPTCSVFAVTAEAGSWRDFMESKKTLLFFERPKDKEAP